MPVSNIANTPAANVRRPALRALLAAAVLACVALPGAAQAYGRWQHGWHGDRFGWWWVDAGMWSWYAANWPWYPAYPYPYPPPYYSAPVEPAVTAALPAPVQVWYYCDAGNGYYPQVPSCPSGWRVVTITPSEAPAAPPPASAVAPANAGPSAPAMPGAAPNPGQ